MPNTNDTAVTPAWKEVTAALSMADGTSYVVEYVSDDADSVLEMVDSTTNSAPADTKRGHRLFPGTRTRQADYGDFTKRTGSYWWGRTLKGKGNLVVTDIATS